ncbi:MAG: hypothetical protein IVW55_00615 [Chloroflexi bacterium]|nr:hypothetical protein [Chloroflexota bacterium]
MPKRGHTSDRSQPGAQRQEADWKAPGAREHAQALVSHLLEELRLNDATSLIVARTLAREVFQARGLGGMLRVVYRNSPYYAAIDVRPELASWRHAPVSDDYWRGVSGIERAQAATACLLEEFGLDKTARQDPRSIVGLLPRSVFDWCDLGGMLDVVYAGSPTAALRAIFPALPPWRHERSRKGYWQGEEGQQRAQEATRRLIGEYGWGGLSAEEVALRVSRKMFLQHGLSGMLDAVYERRGYDALADIYPGLQPWQMSTAPSGYWSGPRRRQHGRIGTRWLIRRLGLTSAPLPEIARRLDKETFEANGLGGLLSCVYNGSPFAALQDVYPDLRPWLVRTEAPHRYWAGKDGRVHAQEALRWMLGELGLQKAPPAEVASVFDQPVFVRMGLSGMLGIVYRNSPYAALSDLFPELRPWQMKNGVPMGYWQGDEERQHAREATIWLLEQYGLQDEDPTDLAAVVAEDMFTRHGLYGMLSILYNSSPYNALTDAFPQLPKREPKTYVPKGYWQSEVGRGHAREGTRSLITSLGLDVDDPVAIAAVIDKPAFIEHGLGAPFREVYGSSAYAALSDLFPELRPWQMGSKVPQRCWQGEEGRRNGVEATRHMLVEMGLLERDSEQIAQVVDADAFERAGLITMLGKVYSGSPYEALKAIFPELRPWQMAKTPREFWQGEEGRQHAREATLWMLSRLAIEAKLGSTGLRTITKETFQQHYLGGMLANIYGNSPHDALADAIPGLLPWQVRSAPREYWQGAEGREHAREATRWLLAELGLVKVGEPIDQSAIANRIDRADFIEAGLGGMLAIVYDGGVYEALSDVAPDLIPWQMGTQVPFNYWKGEQGRENARNAMRWMLAQLGLEDASLAEVAEKVTQEIFIRFGLQGMLASVYRSSRFAALSDILPDLRPWQMGVKVPQGYWRGAGARDRSREALQWLLKAAGLADREPVSIAGTFTKELFSRFGLAGMLQKVYGGSLFCAFGDIFPDMRPWQVALPTPKGYWKGPDGRARAVEATRWLLSQLGFDPVVQREQIVASVTGKHFERLGLGGMLSCVYDDSARLALEDLHAQQLTLG